MSLEGIFIKRICRHLLGFKQRPSGSIFKCPYCQQDEYVSPAKSYSSGSLYGNKNATQFKCHLCGTRRESHTFLKDHFPQLFLDYVADRESYGLTGFQTNCLTLHSAQKSPKKSSKVSPIQLILDSLSQTIPTGESPRVTTYPRPTPQQQAGQAAPLVHACKQKRPRGPDYQADLWLSTDTWHSDQAQPRSK